MRQHPMQPVVFDEHRTIRFRQNTIVRFLLDSGDVDMNRLAAMPFSDADRTQFAQLIGYSVSGSGELSYFDPNVIEKADAEADKLRKTKSCSCGGIPKRAENGKCPGCGRSLSATR